MRVAQYYSNSDIRLQNVPTPPIGDREILMRVEASGICGSDVMEWYRKDKVPLVLGHEVAGVVEKIGKNVRRFKKGDRIVATHHVPCERCEYCLSGHSTVCETLRKTHFDPGGFAEFVRLSNIHATQGTLRIPKTVSYEEASFVEPLGCVLRGQRMAGMKAGKSILVVGSGLAGLLHINLARFHKAKNIFATDIDSYRLQLAKQCGATKALDARRDIPQEVRKFNKGRGADLVILCAPSLEAFRQGIAAVERGGVVLIFTAAPQDAHFPLSINDIFWRTEVTVLSSYAASPQDLKQALRLIAGKKIFVRDMITHRLPLAEIQKGFALMTRPERSLKIIIEPNK